MHFNSIKNYFLYLAILLFLVSCSAGSGFLELFENKYQISEADKGLYGENCGECHFAYQSQLLPKRSWIKMMKPEQLEDHFGEYLEFESDVNLKLVAYLTSDPADTTETKLGRKISDSIPPHSSPLRITETKYYKHKHSDIDDEKVSKNKDVLSFSNCNACHETAAQGNFNEDNVSIPNWD